MKHKTYYHLAGSFTLLFFAALSYLVKFYPATLKAFDRGIILFVHRGSPTANPFFLWVTKFANPITILILGATFLALFLLTRQKISALWFALSLVLVSGIVNPVLKTFFHRVRPTVLPHLVVEHSFSFPSGHAITSMLLYGVVLFALKDFITTRPVRLAVQILLGVLIFLIGISRIYLGVHYPSDVLAGWLLGLSWLLFTYPYYAERKFITQFKQTRRN